MTSGVIGTVNSDENIILLNLLRTNYHTRRILGEALSYIGYNVSTIASGTLTIVSGETSGKTRPWMQIEHGGAINTDLYNQFQYDFTQMGFKEGVILTPNPQDAELFSEAKERNIELKTYDEIITKVSEKQKTGFELEEKLKRIQAEYSGYSHPKATLFNELIRKVDDADTNDRKKKTLETLICNLAIELGLSSIEIDTRTPSSEIDIFAVNERIIGVWKEFGTPILFECKNWEKPIGSSEIRDFALKATPTKTRFFIAWKGITGKDETKGAKLEVIKAKERGIFIMVINKLDLIQIAGGTNPENIIANKYYNLIKDKFD